MSTPSKLPASLRALLAESIDYAGLFPPANLTLWPAIENHGSYLRSPEAWMLRTFVLPVGKFQEAATMLTPFNVEHRLRISALCPVTESSSEFLGTLGSAANAIGEFNEQHGAFAGVAQIEMALPTRPGATVAETCELLAGLDIPTFWEAPPDEAERTIAMIGQHRSESPGSTFGFKVRTGGVVASAFPSGVQLARALAAAVQQRVPIKFTAGLHHPLRKFYQVVHTKMHGFLNVFGAGVLAAEHGWDFLQVAKMLDDEQADSFVFDDEFFSWGEWKVPTARIVEHREVVSSFGSCSFDEPREDLRALNFF